MNDQDELVVLATAEGSGRWIRTSKEPEQKAPNAMNRKARRRWLADRRRQKRKGSKKT